MTYSKYHRLIVEELMSGKFILAGEKSFEDLKNNENFYVSFFSESFGFDLIVKNEFAYLVSTDSAEMLSRDICIFFALLSYELDRDGKNFMDLIRYAEFEFSEVDAYFENSTFIDLIHSNKQLRDTESRKNLVNSMARRNILEKIGEDRFTFTPAHRVFIDFAREFAKGRMAQASEA
ncbi:MAG: hypothetical protein RLZZ46_1501 [Bacteroidota bacterium]|jgi:hypothetical protein